MKSVLITGPNGFLGQNLIKKLSSSEIAPILYEDDICDRIKFVDFINKYKSIDYCFHFAGLSSVKQCLDNPAEAIKINVTATNFMAQELITNFPKIQFVFPSTGQVYAASNAIIDENSNLAPFHFYAETKLKAEENLFKISQSSGLKTTIIRLFNHTHKSQSTNFFLPSIYQKLKDQAQVIKTGDLSVVRDIGAIQDLMEAFLNILEKPQSSLFETFNISSGIGKNLRVTVESLAHTLGQKAIFELDPNFLRSSEPNSIIASSIKFQKCFEWTPKHSLNEDYLIKNFLKDL